MLSRAAEISFLVYRFWAAVAVQDMQPEKGMKATKPCAFVGFLILISHCKKETTFTDKSERGGGREREYCIYMPNLFGLLHSLGLPRGRQ